MKTNKTLLTLICLLIGIPSLFAQWGANGSSIYYNGGNVGIGTSNPAYKLEVYSSSAGNFRLVSNGSTPGFPAIDMYDNVHRTEFVLSPSAGKVDLFTYSNHGLALGTANTERMRILPNGFVGIGTTNPIGKLDINQAGGQLRLSGGTVAGGLWTNATDLLYLADWSTGAKGLTINLSSGNIGIGTTDPGSYKLNVWGRVRAHEIVVNTTGADFVFDKGYRLRPLKEVEQFIQQNKHLPEIPSAAEMQKEGVGVSELQTKLLQKIEELTLYVIELKKNDETLKKDNELLRAELKALQGK